MGAVAILDVDPGLAVGLSEAERDVARRHLVAPALEVVEGPWDPREVGR